MPDALIEPCAGPVDLCDLHAWRPDRYPFLLQSNGAIPASSNKHARYDILFAFPGEHLELTHAGLKGPEACASSDFLDALDSWYRQQAVTRVQTNPLPFTGGWFLYLGYELAGQIEPTLHLPPAPDILPTALAVYCPAALVYDHAFDQLYIVAETARQLHALQADVAQCPRRNRTGDLPVAEITEDDPAHYLQHIQRTQEYIRAGDIFQANLSRGWHAHLSADARPIDLYTALSAANPGPFAGLMCWRGAAVVSSSPERLLSLKQGDAQTRPIAGTRPRNRHDDAITQELLAHPKERAEHVMLIDLERNDLGRICEYGSVHVDELMSLESYAHVHHIVSNVRGRLRRGVGPGAALRAVFPGGTITGCPKVRCMEIIAELEGAGRGAYTGAMGYLSRDGQLDSNILIRTLVHRRRDIWLRAGGGIVADSVADKELEETRAKARGLLNSMNIKT